MKFPQRGLYAITQPERKTLAQILREVEAALKGGAVAVQYRDKQPLDAVGLARQLMTLCHAYRAPLLINDSVELALKVGADGVHLGKDDGDSVDGLPEARHEVAAEHAAFVQAGHILVELALVIAIPIILRSEPLQDEKMAELPPEVVAVIRRGGLVVPVRGVLFRRVYHLGHADDLVDLEHVAVCGIPENWYY